MTTPYEVLGAYCSMNDQEIKATYKVAAQRAHPDKETGSPEKFEAVRVAYEQIATRQARNLYRERVKVAGGLDCLGCRGTGVKVRRKGMGVGAPVMRTTCAQCLGAGVWEIKTPKLIP